MLPHGGWVTGTRFPAGVTIGWGQNLESLVLRGVPVWSGYLLSTWHSALLGGVGQRIWISNLCNNVVQPLYGQAVQFH